MPTVGSLTPGQTLILFAVVAIFVGSVVSGKMGKKKGRDGGNNTPPSTPQ